MSDIGTPSSDRIVRLEELHNAVTGNMERMNTDLGSLADDFAIFVENMNNYIANASKTNWATLAAWGAIILSLVGLPGAWITSNLLRLETNQDEMFREYVIPQGKEIVVLKTKVEQLMRENRILVDSVQALSRRRYTTETDPKP